MAECGFDTDSGLSCCWPIDRNQCCPEVADADPEDEALEAIIAGAEAHASSMLTRLSGYTVGQCEAVIRPLGVCSECRTWCCGGTDSLRLVGPMGLPVDQVTEIHLGADIVDPTDWRFDRPSQTLYARPGFRWPRRDEKWSDCGEGEAFCVSAIVGTAPDAWALSVASSLVCELVKSCTGGKCRLPRNATQVTGQGITITLSDADLRNLLPEVTGWVSAVNPHKAQLPARIYSPDLGPSSHGPRGRGCCR